MYRNIAPTYQWEYEINIFRKKKQMTCKKYNTMFLK